MIGIEDSTCLIQNSRKYIFSATNPRCAWLSSLPSDTPYFQMEIKPRVNGAWALFHFKTFLPKLQSSIRITTPPEKENSAIAKANHTLPLRSVVWLTTSPGTSQVCVPSARAKILLITIAKRTSVFAEQRPRVYPMKTTHCQNIGALHQSHHALGG